MLGAHKQAGGVGARAEAADLPEPCRASPAGGRPPAAGPRAPWPALRSGHAPCPAGSGSGRSRRPASRALLGPVGGRTAFLRQRKRD